MNKGTRSIAVFDTAKPELKLEYLFDVKDTNGAFYTIPRLWKASNILSPQLVDKFNKKYNVHFENDYYFKTTTYRIYIYLNEKLSHIYVDLSGKLGII